MKRSKLLLVGLASMIVSTSNAQFLERLKNGVQTSVEETVIEKSEEKAEEETEGAMDGLFGIGKKKKKKSSSNDNSSDGTSTPNNTIGEQGTNSGSSEATEILDEYVFNFSSKINFESYEKKEKDVTTIKQTYGKESLLTEASGALMIYDFSAESIILVSQEEKTAQVMSMSFMESMMANAVESEVEDNNEESSVTKTGETKMMLGYTCYEYIIINGSEKTQIWFAPDVPFEYSDYLESFSGMFQSQSTSYNNEMGYMMEMTNYDENGKKISYMVVTELIEETITIPLNKYKVTKLM